MQDDEPDYRALTDTQLANLVRERVDEVRHLREAIHDFGPSLAREQAITRKQQEIDHAERELAHRRIERQHDH